ncbi:hypothetical protein SCLCIDRAFT_31813 [Scleroderma citrinum Foug A]|uniref:Uncharacterized protein n=1 Tax=Scleroderma citrinum Foug A TaxID=1036808 RepID=A0A0C3CY70_9AGAM|nr:hypothetical protein SCLCIDRAFT_31813 [Scleroderma citrinum Foug A]
MEAIEQAKQSLGISDQDLTRWKNEQSEYLKNCHKEPEWDMLAVAYVELLQKLTALWGSSESANASFLHTMPESYASTSETSYYASLSHMQKLETMHYVANEHYTEVLQEVNALEYLLKVGASVILMDLKHLNSHYT